MDKNTKVIINALHSIQDIWCLDNQSIEISKLNNFIQLFDKKMEKYSLLLKEKEKNKIDDKNLNYALPYNASPFHFFLYYAYPPNIPFVIFGKECIIFGSFIGRRSNNIFLSFPFYKNTNTCINELNEFFSNSKIEFVLKKFNIKTVLLRDINERFANILLKHKKSEEQLNKFNLKSLKEMKYNIYDIDRTLKRSGKAFRNLRWHLNNFRRKKHKIEAVPLHKSVKNIIHLIGEWRRTALKERGFSYVNVSSDIFGAKLFGNPNYKLKNSKLDNKISYKDVLTRVLKIDGKVASFNLGYPLGLNKKSQIFAHAIGIADINIKGLAEYGAIDFWKVVKNNGYKYINDGPTWRKGLVDFKNKFGAIDKKRYYWATILLL